MNKIIYFAIIFSLFFCDCESYSSLSAEVPVIQESSGEALVSWDPNTEDDLAGYKIYYGTSSGSYDDALDVGNKTSFSINNLVVGTTYFFAVTAYDVSGNESIFSSQVFITIKEDTTDNGGGNLEDNRLPSLWKIGFWNNRIFSEKIVLQIIAHEDEMFDGNGWTIWGHVNREIKDSGIFILNPDSLTVRVLFDAKIIGEGSCLDEMLKLKIEEGFWDIGTNWQKVEFESSSNKIFINFIGDCWILNETDANLRITNIEIFK